MDSEIDDVIEIRKELVQEIAEEISAQEKRLKQLEKETQVYQEEIARLKSKKKRMDREMFRKMVDEAAVRHANDPDFSKYYEARYS